MRVPVVSLLSIFAFTGCTSSGIDGLAPDRPVVTGSIERPVPAEEVAAANSANQSEPIADAQPSSLLPENSAAQPVNQGQTGAASSAESVVVAQAAEKGVGQPQQAEALPPVPAQKPDIEQPTRTAAVIKPKIVSTSGKAPLRYRVYNAKFRDRKPINFSKAHPRHFAVHGVDVSRWQADIDWATLRKQGANFAYIKSTEGGDHLDPKFKENWVAAKKAGIPRGAYHFFYWCRPAADQAKWFIRNVPKEKGALPPVIDVEWNAHSRTCPKRVSRATALRKMKTFMSMVERHYGQQPVIYTAPDFYKDNLQGQFNNYSFWLRSVAEHPSIVYPNREFAFWQYSGTGLSKGVSTEIDLNVFNGSREGWYKWLGERVK